MVQKFSQSSFRLPNPNSEVVKPHEKALIQDELALLVHFFLSFFLNRLPLKHQALPQIRYQLICTLNLLPQ